jgi:hypothetical protein
MSNLKKALDPTGVDTQRESLNDFEQKIAFAMISNDEWVETTPEIITYFNRNGLGKDNAGKPLQYFIYKGKKVCEFGKIDAIEAEEAEQIGTRLFGKAEGIVEGRA